MTYDRIRGLFYWLAPGVLRDLHSLYWCHFLRESWGPGSDDALSQETQEFSEFFKSVTQSL